ncbi:MAG: metallophosphoesterase [Firmicutes bacterium]|nr:metallophosphoesterase [Bacillota bacterium]
MVKRASKSVARQGTRQGCQSLVGLWHRRRRVHGPYLPLNDRAKQGLRPTPSSWYNRFAKGASTIRIYAIGDLHLSFGVNKPMDIFGSAWTDHATKVKQAWLQTVQPEDAIMIAGDISWAMRYEEVRPDLAYLSELPGRKILLRGNHDYWWATRSKVANWAGETCEILQNNAIVLADKGIAVVGTRGWDLPSQGATVEDKTIYDREVQRLRLSLEAGRETGLPLWAMVHFPPLTTSLHPTPISDLLEAYNVRVCVYGHLHGSAHKMRVEGSVRGVHYHLVSADYLSFAPMLVPDPA